MKIVIALLTSCVTVHLPFHYTHDRCHHYLSGEVKFGSTEGSKSFLNVSSLCCLKSETCHCYGRRKRWRRKMKFDCWWRIIYHGFVEWKCCMKFVLQLKLSWLWCIIICLIATLLHSKLNLQPMQNKYFVSSLWWFWFLATWIQFIFVWKKESKSNVQIQTRHNHTHAVQYDNLINIKCKLHLLILPTNLLRLGFTSHSL